jgi:probable HAF family extracellular repeat protein
MKTARITLVAIAALAASAWSSSARAQTVTVLGTASNGGYVFTNFDGPTPNGGGTTINGISNNGTVVGFSTPDGMTFNNFAANPLLSTTATALNINNSTAAMANGINSAGTIVGTDGNNNAFTFSGGTVTNSYIPNNGVSAIAFGINDHGVIVGQYTTNADTTPGYVLNGTTLTTINAPSGPDVVNAQGINNNGLVVGFYLGTDGQVHGFMTQYNAASPPSTLTGTAIADPTIPTVAGEPGATFVFSQILGINDQGIAVGYYGDSTTSQHGFLYNTNTGQYTFLDDPSQAFNNGVEVTQITGINNAGEITGFYTDANGIAHGFVGSAVPEPGTMGLMAIGMSGMVGYAARRRMRKASEA